MQVSTAVEAEMNVVIAKRKKITALTRDMPRLLVTFMKMGEEVLAYSENEKKFVDSILVADIIGKMIVI